MTYCVGIKVDEGLVFAGDTRTSASVDDIRTYNKLHVFEFPDRVLVLLSAGNLATTQAALCQIQRDLEDGAGATTLRTVRHLYDAAEYLGQVSLRAARKTPSEGDFRASWIIGGQLRGDPHELYLVYAEGNFIACSPETPYVQIGETKYGKPMLDRVIRGETPLDDAALCALVSLDASMKSNISVGPPVDLAIVPRDTLRVAHRQRFDADTPYWQALRQAWGRSLTAAFSGLPRLDWQAPPPLQQAARERRRGT